MTRKSFSAFFLERINAGGDPVMRLWELQRYPEEQWQPLIDQKLLTPYRNPENVLMPDGRWLRVVRFKEKLFGMDDSEDYPSPEVLKPNDLVVYSIQKKHWRQRLRESNGIEAREMSTQGFELLGKRAIEGGGAVNVWLALAMNFEPALVGKLFILGQNQETNVVVFPQPHSIPPDQVAMLANAGVHLAEFEDWLTIRWPELIGRPMRLGDVSNREVLGAFERHGAAVKARVDALEAENAMLKQQLGELFSNIGKQVEPEFTCWIITILATGTVKAAADRLGMPNSTLDRKLKAYVARGGAYETLFGLLDVRRKGLGMKSVVEFDESKSKNHAGGVQADDISLLQDLFDALEILNASNWPQVRDEMMELLREAMG